MNVTELISKFSIFSEISVNYINEIAQQVELLEFDSGEMVFQEGEDASHIYGVLKGEVELAIVAEDKILKTDVQFEEYTHTQTETVEREIIVDSIGTGEIFGWSALTRSGRFTSKAVCAEPTKLFALPADGLKTFFKQQPQVGYQFMEGLTEIISKRFSSRTDKLIEGWIEAFEVNRI